MNYSSKKAQILNVLSWSAKDWIDTYYFDESGFSLDSNIPYYWSPIGKPVEIPSNRFAKRINVLGFLNTKNNHLFSKTTITVGTQRIWPARAFTLGHLTHNDLASVRIAKRATKSL